MCDLPSESLSQIQQLLAKRFLLRRRHTPPLSRCLSLSSGSRSSQPNRPAFKSSSARPIHGFGNASHSAPEFGSVPIVLAPRWTPPGLMPRRLRPPELRFPAGLPPTAPPAAPPKAPALFSASGSFVPVPRAPSRSALRGDPSSMFVPANPPTSVPPAGVPAACGLPGLLGGGPPGRLSRSEAFVFAPGGIGSIDLSRPLLVDLLPAIAQPRFHAP